MSMQKKIAKTCHIQMSSNYWINYIGYDETRKGSQKMGDKKWKKIYQYLQEALISFINLTNVGSGENVSFLIPKPLKI